MALRYGYFDSEIIGVDEEGMPILDRAETSDLFALLFSKLVSDGVLADPATCFRITAANNGLSLNRAPGFGMVKGHFAYDDESDTLTISSAPQTYSRIDRVIMRCNYLERTVEILIKTGTEAARPEPPELIRPSAGDYFELCLADITLTAGQTLITQSSITDRRPDSSVCGYITQLIDHLDTAVFFEQLNTFYAEFVDKSNASYTQFVQMAQQAYDSFNADITGYIAKLKQDSTTAYNDLIYNMNNYFNSLTSQGKELFDQYTAELTSYVQELEERGDREVAAIVQQMLNFMNENTTLFTQWFDQMKNQLSEDAAGKLQLQVNDLTAQVGDLEAMLFSGLVRALLFTDKATGDYLTDSLGNPLLIGWPICKCNQ